MRDVAVVAFSQVPSLRRGTDRNEVEMVQTVVQGAFEQAQMTRDDIGFTVSGSSDFLIGRPFSFVMALDGISAWPPIRESHVEMDGAWALYEAWIRLQHGDIDAALVYSFGRSSAGDLPDVLTTQLDPYYLAPLGPDAVSIAALQAQALLDTGRYTELDFARVAAQNRRRGQDNPMAQVTGDFDVDSLMAEMPIVTPLRKHDCPPISDGAAAVILAAGDTARKHVERPAWIRGIDHRMEPHNFAARDWTRSPSTALAASKVGLTKGEEVDVVELHAPFSHQECILLDALGLEGDPLINPSGGALCANPVMAAGLIRMGEAAAAIHRGDARRALAHATSGPALQQNMVCLMEGE